MTKRLKLQTQIKIYALAIFALPFLIFAADTVAAAANDTGSSTSVASDVKIGNENCGVNAVECTVRTAVHEANSTSGADGEAASARNFSFALDQSVAGTSGLVAWFAGEGDARDVSFNGNDGSLDSRVRFGIGKSGQAFDFSQISSFGVAVFGSNNVPNGDAARTVEMWIYTKNDSWIAYRTFFHQGVDDNNRAFALATSGSSANRQILIYGWFNDITVNVTAETTVTGWQHVAVIYSGGGNARLIVNGIDKGALTFPNGALNTASASILLGGGGGSGVYNERIDEASIYNRALSIGEVQAVYSAGAKGKTKQINFAARTSVKVAAATINFPSAQNGTANEQGLDGTGLPPITDGMPRLYYDVSTTASTTGASVCFNVAALAADFDSLRVYHLESGNWVDRTAASNASPNLCTTALSSFSPFAIVQVAPTAANVSVGGRILTAEGYGIRNARVTLTKLDGTTETVLTGSFGYYNFDEIEAGQTVVVRVYSKSYVFEPNSNVITPNDNVANADFTARGLNLK